jgi:hypothetical protein
VVVFAIVDMNIHKLQRKCMYIWSAYPIKQPDEVGTGVVNRTLPSDKTHT